MEDEIKKELNFFEPTREYYRSIRQMPEPDFDMIHIKGEEELEAFLGKGDPDFDMEKEMEKLAQMEKDGTGPFAPESEQEIIEEEDPNIEHTDEAKAIKVYFEEKEESIKLAEEILKEYPNCIEAQMSIIGWEQNSDKRIEKLEDLLEKEEDNLPISSEFLLTDKGRSFLRLKSSLGQDYLLENYYEDGMELIYEVFEEDTLDDFGVGFIIAVELAKKGKWPALNKFWNKFDAQENIITSVLRTITYFNIYGNKVKSKNALNEAYALDSTPFDVISGALSAEGMDEDDFGDDDALFAVNILYDVMSKNDKLTRWIITNLMKKEQ